MDAKSLIAWLALGISAATFVWKFVETYIRWPHIGVVMRQSITIFPAHFHVAVGETDVVTIRGGTPLSSVFPDENPAQNETASSELSDAASNHPRTGQRRTGSISSSSTVVPRPPRLRM